MEPEGDEVLRKLPRSRPGTRSSKRKSQKRPATASKRAAESAERRGSAAARTPGAARTRPRPSEEPAPGGDPLRDAAKLAMRAAGAGVQVAGAVSRELLRRIPRP
jgi:hypothetical protein